MVMKAKMLLLMIKINVEFDICLQIKKSHRQKILYW